MLSEIQQAALRAATISIYDEFTLNNSRTECAMWLEQVTHVYSNMTLQRGGIASFGRLGGQLCSSIALILYALKEPH